MDLQTLAGQRAAVATEVLAAASDMVRQVEGHDVAAARSSAWRLAVALPILTELIIEAEVAHGALNWVPKLSLDLRMALRHDHAAFLRHASRYESTLELRLRILRRALGVPVGPPSIPTRFEAGSAFRH